MLYKLFVKPNTSFHDLAYAVCQVFSTKGQLILIRVVYAAKPCPSLGEGRFSLISMHVSSILPELVRSLKPTSVASEEGMRLHRG